MVLGISLIGCSATIEREDAANNPGEAKHEKVKLDGAVLEGYVVKKEGESILVVSSVPKDFSSTGGVKEYYDAIWASEAPKELEPGQKVRVWFKGPLAESYPAHGTAERVWAFQSNKPEGATLSEAQAINKALITQKDYTAGIIIIKGVKYDIKSDSWNIHMQETHKESDFNVQVDDK